MKKNFLLSFICLLIGIVLCGCGTQALTDGIYSIEVSLSGGSGRASIDSPALLTIDGETKIATIVWSSPFYEYMLVDDIRYDPVQTDGNATFEIPIVLDTDMAVSASTIAMSQPHLVEYTLYFDSATAKIAKGEEL